MFLKKSKKRNNGKNYRKNATNKTKLNYNKNRP